MKVFKWYTGHHSCVHLWSGNFPEVLYRFRGIKGTEELVKILNMINNPGISEVSLQNLTYTQNDQVRSLLSMGRAEQLFLVTYCAVKSGVSLSIIDYPEGLSPKMVQLYIDTFKDRDVTVYLKSEFTPFARIARDRGLLTAILTNIKDDVLYVNDNKMIKFKGPKGLQYIVGVKEWEKGYLVVKAKYGYSEELLEDYIDLKFILDDLKIDSDLYFADVSMIDVWRDPVEVNTKMVTKICRFTFFSDEKGFLCATNGVQGCAFDKEGNVVHTTLNTDDTMKIWENMLRMHCN